MPGVRPTTITSMTQPPFYTNSQLSVAYDYVAVVDGLSLNERQNWGISAALTAHLGNEKIDCRLAQCDNSEGLAGALNVFASDAQLGKRFCMHFVCHGNQHGIQIGPATQHSSFVKWNELYTHFVAINGAMNGALLINMTTCKGLHAAKVVQLNGAPLPFFGLIGALRDLPIDDALAINTLFYEKQLSGMPIQQIVPSINQERGEEILYCVSGEGYQKLMSLATP